MHFQFYSCKFPITKICFIETEFLVILYNVYRKYFMITIDLKYFKTTRYINQYVEQDVVGLVLETICLIS